MNNLKIVVCGVSVWMILLTTGVFLWHKNTDIPDLTPTPMRLPPPAKILVDIIEDDYFYHIAPIKVSSEELYCLQRNVFFEAGIESYEGKLAVAQVTLNRLETGRWGNNICDVVFARAQFSWTLWKKNRTKKPSGPLWNESVRVVQEFLDGKRITDINSSLHYHADYIQPPKWADADRRIAQIGQHVFYER